MHIEFKNCDTGLYYYLCGPKEDPAAIVWNPAVKEYLLTLDSVMTVGQLAHLLQPMLKNLTEQNDNRWEVKLFKFTGMEARSLTDSVNTVSVYGHWRVGDPSFLDGVEQPLRLISL